MSEETLPTPKTPINDLHPSNIDPRSIIDPEEQKKAKQRLDTWVEDIQKKISDVLEENGVLVYEICFYHKGTGTPIVNARGTTYSVAKLAAAAARSLKKQVDEELAS